MFKDRLFELQDKEYAKFHSRLMPGVDFNRIIGVRVPLVRKLAKELIKDKTADDFYKQLPHSYYDEDMLHGVMISLIKDYDTCLKEVDDFLPYVDNWAVCDIMSPVVFRKHKKELIDKVKEWSASSKVYTCRFGLKMLMTYYLDDDFKDEYLQIPASIVSDEYYINMMIAWFFATALAKKWDETIAYLEDKRLGSWVHNKTIQKAIESYRITKDQKDYLRSLRIKK